MSYEPENFSFIQKPYLQDRKIPLFGADTKVPNEKEGIKDTDSLFRPQFQNRRVVLRHMLNDSADSPFKQSFFQPKQQPVKVDIPSRIQDSLRLSGRRISSMQDSENQSRIVIRAVEESFMETIDKDKPKPHRADKKLEVPRLSLVGQSFLKSNSNCSSTVSGALSARSHDRNREMHTNMPDAEQIEKFKNLLKQHPEPILCSQYHRIQRKFRPKSHYQPLTNLFSSRIDYVANLEGSAKIGNVSPENSLEKSGFLSETKSASLRPDYNEILPTKPIILSRTREFSLNRQQIVSSSQSQQRTTPIVPVLKLQGAQMLKNVTNPHAKAALSDRPKKTSENDSVLTNSTFIDKNFSEFTNKAPPLLGNKIYIRKSPIAKIHKLSEIPDEIANEGFLSERKHYSPPKFISDLRFRTENNEGNYIDDVPDDQLNKFEASGARLENEDNQFLRKKIVKRLKLKDSFGNIGSSEKDLLQSIKDIEPAETKGNVQLYQRKDNTEQKTPKFKVSGPNVFQNISNLPENSLTKQSNYPTVSDTDLRHKPIISASQSKTSKLKITKLQTANRSYGRSYFN